MIELRAEELENINGGNLMGDISSAAGDVYNTLSNASTGSEIGAGVGAVAGEIIDPMGGGIPGAEIGSRIGGVAGAIWNYC